MFQSFNLKDANQITIGAFDLAVPIPITNLILIFILSVGFLSFYAYESLFQGQIKYRIVVFVLRIFIVYLIATLDVSLVLLALDKLPAFIRTIDHN